MPHDNPLRGTVERLLKMNASRLRYEGDAVRDATGVHPAAALFAADRQTEDKTGTDKSSLERPPVNALERVLARTLRYAAFCVPEFVSDTCSLVMECAAERKRVQSARPGQVASKQLASAPYASVSLRWQSALDEQHYLIESGMRRSPLNPNLVINSRPCANGTAGCAAYREMMSWKCDWKVPGERAPFLPIAMISLPKLREHYLTGRWPEGSDGKTMCLICARYFVQFVQAARLRTTPFFVPQWHFNTVGGRHGYKPDAVLYRNHGDSVVMAPIAKVYGPWLSVYYNKKIGLHCIDQRMIMCEPGPHREFTFDSFPGLEEHEAAVAAFMRSHGGQPGDASIDPTEAIPEAERPLLYLDLLRTMRPPEAVPVSTVHGRLSSSASMRLVEMGDLSDDTDVNVDVQTKPKDGPTEKTAPSRTKRSRSDEDEKEEEEEEIEVHARADKRSKTLSSITPQRKASDVKTSKSSKASAKTTSSSSARDQALMPPPPPRVPRARSPVPDEHGTHTDTDTGPREDEAGSMGEESPPEIAVFGDDDAGLMGLGTSIKEEKDETLAATVASEELEEWSDEDLGLSAPVAEPSESKPDFQKAARPSSQ